MRTNKSKLNIVCSPRYFLLLGVCLTIFSFSSGAQTKGIIYDPARNDVGPTAGAALLDPNGDGFVSSDNTGFSADDETESDIAYIAIPTAGTEGEGDVSHGATCSYIDFVNTPETEALYFYSDGLILSVIEARK